MLDEIVRHKQEQVGAYGKDIMERFQKTEALPSLRRFAEALDAEGRVSLIAEMKKASPVRGRLTSETGFDQLPVLYEENGAKAISVITEERYFQGSPLLIQKVKSRVSLPVLRKDFIIDIKQLYETRLLGADAVLLIACLLPRELPIFVETAQQLGIEPVVEVHDRDELEKALDTPARIIGINNRNLRDFTVNTQVCLDLVGLAGSKVQCIAESGIRTGKDMRVLEQHGFSAALVGEALVTAPDVAAKTRELAWYWRN